MNNMDPRASSDETLQPDNTVYNIDFTRSLPPVLKEDGTMLALGKTVAGELQKNIELTRLNIIYARIDEMEENILDILAYDLHIDWYDPDAPIDLKRTLIKESVKVHKGMGTKFAVETVVRTYFGSGEVRMWYEYGGRPHHFKVISSNPSITNEDAEKFFRLLWVVKRLSSWLETILITLTGESNIYIGTVVAQHNRETHFMGPHDTVENYRTLYIKELFPDRTREIHIIKEGRS